MRAHINIRGADRRGEFTIQTQVESPSLMQALDAVLAAWEIDRRDLRRVHLEPVKGDGADR